MVDASDYSNCCLQLRRFRVRIGVVDVKSLYIIVEMKSEKYCGYSNIEYAQPTVM